MRANGRRVTTRIINSRGVSFEDGRLASRIAGGSESLVDFKVPIIDLFSSDNRVPSDQPEKINFNRFSSLLRPDDRTHEFLSPLLNCLLGIAFVLCFFTGGLTRLEAEQAEEGAVADTESLSSQATDPTASLMALNFQTLSTRGFHGPSGGLDDDRTVFQFRPVLPYHVWDLPNILRLTVPYQVDGRGDEGFGSI